MSPRKNKYWFLAWWLSWAYSLHENEKSRNLFYWKLRFYRLILNYPLIYLVECICIRKNCQKNLITIVLNILYMLQILLLETSSTVSEMLEMLKQLQPTLISRSNNFTQSGRGKHYLTAPIDLNLRLRSVAIILIKILKFTIMQIANLTLLVLIMAF